MDAEGPLREPLSLGEWRFVLLLKMFFAALVPTRKWAWDVAVDLHTFIKSGLPSDAFRVQCRCGNSDFANLSKHGFRIGAAVKAGPCMVHCHNPATCTHAFLAASFRKTSEGRPCHCEAWAAVIAMNFFRGTPNWGNSDPMQWAIAPWEIVKLFVINIGEFDKNLARPSVHALSKTGPEHCDITTIFNFLRSVNRWHVAAGNVDALHLSYLSDHVHFVAGFILQLRNQNCAHAPEFGISEDDLARCYTSLREWLQDCMPVKYAADASAALAIIAAIVGQKYTDHAFDIGDLKTFQQELLLDQTTQFLQSSFTGPLAPTMTRVLDFVQSQLPAVPVGDDASQLKTDEFLKDLWTLMVLAQGTCVDICAPLRTVPAHADAEAFWKKYGLRVQVSVQTLLNYLQREAQSWGWIPSASVAKGFNEIPELYSFFAGPNNSETTDVSRFVVFLGGASTLRDALRPYLGAYVEEFAIGMSASKFAASGSTAILTEVARRRVLQPVEFGNDLVRHNTAFVPGTRMWLFDEVEKWARLRHGCDGQRILWLQGTAGLGKSVVAAQLVARHCHVNPHGKDDLYIAAHIFCKHDDQSRNDPVKVIATLAYRLAAQLPEFANILDGFIADEKRREYIEACLRKSDINEVFNILLAEPIGLANIQRDIVLLIDALDELTAGPSRVALLTLIGSLVPTLPDNVRIIVTARPEPDIVESLQRLAPLILQKNDAHQKTDLLLYLRQEAVGKTSLCNCTAAEQNDVVQYLLDFADGVFLAASGLARSMQENCSEPWTPARVKATFNVRGDELVDVLYLDALKRADQRLVRIAEIDPSWNTFDLRALLRNTLSVLVAMAVPVSRAALPFLCGGLAHAQSIAATLKIVDVLTLLFTSTDALAPLEPCHKSVFDFLLSPTRSREWCVDLATGHATLAGSCLRGWRQDADINNPASEYIVVHAPSHLAECIRRGLKGNRVAYCAAMHQEWLRALRDVSKNADNGAAGMIMKATARKLESFGEFAQSHDCFETLLSEFLPSADNQEKADILLSLAFVAGRAAKYKRASSAAEEAFSLLEKAGVKENGLDLYQSRVWYQMGINSDIQGQYPEALGYFEKYLTVVREKLGERHPETAKVYNNMANVYNKQSAYKLALDYYQKSLDIKRLTYGEMHQDTARTYAGMASVFNQQGFYPTALEYFDKCLKIRRVTLGENHPDTASTYSNTAMVLEAQDKLVEALEYYNKSLLIRRGTIGEYHTDTARSYAGLGSVYNQLKDYPQALTAYQKCLSIRLGTIGDKNPDTAKAYAGVAKTYFHQGQFPAALENYDACLKIRRGSVFEIHPDTARAYSGMGDVFVAQGNFDKALEMFQLGAEMAQSKLGDGHSDTLCMLKSKAIVLEKLGKLVEALAVFEMVVTILSARKVENQAEITGLQGKMAGIYIQQGDHASAISCLQSK